MKNDCITSDSYLCFVCVSVCECLMFRRALQEHVCGKRFALPGCCVVQTFMRCNGPTNCARYEATALQGAFD